MNDLAEMARIASSYTTRLSPGRIRMSRLGRFIWLRLDDGFETRGSERTNDRKKFAGRGHQPGVQPRQ